MDLVNKWSGRAGRDEEPEQARFFLHSVNIFLVFPKGSVKPCGKIVRSRLERPDGGVSGGLIVK
ncbi:TPA: hypothetical protein ACLMYJ_003140 [Pseudomonas aeruginosa]